MIFCTQRKTNNSKGFTLLEVLIAIAIFSVISLASFTIFDTVLNSDETSKKRTDRLNELQRAFLIIERDLLQLSKRTMRLNGEQPSEKFIHQTDSSFFSSSQSLAFVRHGWTNPALLLPRSDMQSVAYQLNDNTVERLHFNYVDAVLGQEPKVRPLITLVNTLSFEYYYTDNNATTSSSFGNSGKDSHWEKKLNDKGLPLAIAIEIDTEDYGIIRRQFLVAGGNL
jgi:general secretion pathway protein J